MALLACGQPGSQANPSHSPGAQDNVAVSPKLVNGLNRFSLKLFEPVAQTMKGNLALSPLGSYILLGILEQGTAGEARQEIAEVTGLRQGGDLKALTQLVGALDRSAALALAQRIYVSDTVVLTPTFLEAVSSLLPEAVQSLAFETDPAAATASINAWVAEKTSGLIKDFLPLLPAETKSVLVSVLHFKGTWKREFDKKLTVPAPFHPSSTEAITVPMMAMSKVPTVEVAGAHGVILPYKEDYDMLFLLPAPDQTPEGLVAALEAENLPKTASGPQVQLRLPRFEFTVPTFALTDAWRSVGLESTVARPDLSAMMANPADNLELRVYHKTYIRVDEEGTEAAAATAVTIVPTSAGPPPAVLSFDRPFLFVLRHSGSGAILMLGRVQRPETAGA